MTLVRYNPYRSLTSLPSAVDRFFRNFGLDSDYHDSVWAPSIDVLESEQKYEVKAELPGMHKKDINVSVENNVLTLSGERKQEYENNDNNYHRIERAYGRFERSFQLPENVKAEDIKAKYQNGILNLEIPKSEKEKPKAIPVS